MDNVAKESECLEDGATDPDYRGRALKTGPSL